MRLSIRTLTPLHIGNGNTLQVSDYIILDGDYIRISLSKVFALIAESGKLSEVLRLLENKLELFENEKDAGTQAEIRNDLDLLHLCQQVDPVLKSKIEARLDEIALYRIPSYLPCAINRRLINEQLKSGVLRVSIPGSTIKGAIRTALLAHVIKYLDQSEKNDIIIFIDDVLKQYRMNENQRLLKTVDDHLVNVAFNCGIKKNNYNNISYQDVKFDLLKLLFVSDSSDMLAQDCLAVVNPIQYALSSDTGEQESRNPCEAIIPSSTFFFDLKLLTDLILTIRSKSKASFQGKSGIRDSKGNIFWLGFSTKLHHLFNLDLELLEKQRIEEQENVIIEHILDCCRDFYREVLWHDRNWIENIKSHRETDSDFGHLERFHELLDLLMQEGALLIKTGSGTGFHTKTVMLKMMLDDIPEKKCLQDSMTKLLKTFAIGIPQNHKGRYTLNLNNFPTSRPVVHYGHEPDLFGWVMLQNKPLSENQQIILSAIDDLRFPAQV